MRSIFLAAVSPVLVLVGLSFLLTGCKTESTVGLVVNPGHVASITVEGSNPMVIVTNDGPGTIVVLFTPRGWPGGDEMSLAQASSGRTMRDGGEVRITNDSKQRAVVNVNIQKHTGVTIDGPRGPAPSP